MTNKELEEDFKRKAELAPTLTEAMYWDRKLVELKKNASKA